ncbi:isochorismatase family protein [Paenibacillus lautus]|uniref:isochorismatase family protein n=1 Tax=Paenibacillus lautus TaxID=1401 RepID=UPI003D2CFDEB
MTHKIEISGYMPQKDILLPCSRARDGIMLDYHIVLVADACASYSSTVHEMALQNIEGNFGKVSKVAQLIDIGWIQRLRNRCGRCRWLSQPSASLSEYASNRGKLSACGSFFYERHRN